ncbi:hypothetical protein JTB14_026986 [Gonioctena quinquepunctata]|nr:hypothetical protein JTB14_026986 [Gonioctena quinquepunctata]
MSTSLLFLILTFENRVSQSLFFDEVVLQRMWSIHYYITAGQTTLRKHIATYTAMMGIEKKCQIWQTLWVTINRFIRTYTGCLDFNKEDEESSDDDEDGVEIIEKTCVPRITSAEGFEANTSFPNSSLNHSKRRSKELIIVKWPTGHDYNQVVAGFAAEGFPNTIGAIDGCHIEIPKPKEQCNELGKYTFLSILLSICNRDDSLLSTTIANFLLLSTHILQIGMTTAAYYYR